MKSIIHRALYFIFCLVFCTISIVSLTACENSSDDKSFDVVCSVFPLYDWTREIVSDTDTRLHLIIDNGTDSHSFQPTAKDITTLLSADLVIYIGGESESWIDDLFVSHPSSTRHTLKLLDAIGDRAKFEELQDGMEGEDDDGGENEYDEHIYLSLKNARICVKAIEDTLSNFNEPDADTYDINASKYLTKLVSLDTSYKKAVDMATNRTLIFGDRFPFRYLIDDYELNYYAAFAGCSAETEASFKTIDFLSKKIDELHLKYIIKLETSNGAVANAIKQNTTSKNQTVLTINSIQSTKIKDNKTYLEIMRDNLEVLKIALS